MVCVTAGALDDDAHNYYGPSMSKLGPLPTTSTRREQLSGPRRTVLDLLVETQRPMTVAVVAARLGQHPNTVREHLDALVRAHLASRDQLPPAGRGRPASAYTYTPEGSFSSPEYAVLAQVLVTYLTRVIPAGPVLRRHAHEAGRAWGQAILDRDNVAHGPDAAGSGRAPVRRGGPGDRRHGGGGPGDGGTRGGARKVTAPVGYLQRLLDRSGFDPEYSVDEVGGTETLRLPRCPVLALATERPEVVCAAHLGMAREILATADVPADDVRLDAFVEPGACLLYVAARGGPGRDGAGAGPTTGTGSTSRATSGVVRATDATSEAATGVTSGSVTGVVRGSATGVVSAAGATSGATDAAVDDGLRIGAPGMWPT
ncbi:MAG: helix-turn-helix transcriptional regulator [Georgenia sp.]